MTGPKNKEDVFNSFMKQMPFSFIFFIVLYYILDFCGIFSTEEELKNFSFVLCVLYLIGEFMCKKALLFIKEFKENKVPDNSKLKLVMKAFNICIMSSLVVFLFALGIIPNLLSNKYIVGLLGFDLLIFIMVFLFCCKKILSYNPEVISNKFSYK